MDDLISRQAAIEALKSRQDSGKGDISRFYNTIIQHDIEAIEQLPPAQLGTNLAEVGTDAVSRKAVKELAYSQIRSVYCGVALKEQRETMLRIADNVIGLLAPVTSAQPATSCSEIPNGSDDTISRQAAIDALNEVVKDHSITDFDAIASILDLPPAQPEIIRCRECKFASGDSRICMKFGHSPIGELDFCAWAERRTDG